MNKRMIIVGTLVVSFSFIFIVITSNSSENQEWDFLKKPIPSAFFVRDLLSLLLLSS